MRDPGELEAVAVSAAQAAAALIRVELGRAARVGTKSSPSDVVTQTDIDSERLIRRLLHEATPEAGFLGEEGGETEAGAWLQWVIDPLDGTVNFLYALPLVAVSIGAALDGEVVAGAVVDVVRDETFSASARRGARLDGRPIKVTNCQALAQALVTTGFSYRAAVRARQAAVVCRLLPEARDIRCFGSAALELCWVAAGRTDAYFERDIKVWDYAAGSLIAREAGALTELPCPENDGLVLTAAPGVFSALRAIVGHG